MNAYSLGLALHAMAAVVWVGGMFFAYMSLRPVAATLLPPPQRLPLWSGVFGRFFPWVWAAVILLPLSGYFLIFQVWGGMGGAPLRVHLMNGLAVVMITIFAFVFFGPYRRLQRAVATEAWPEAGAALAVIRRWVGINLLLGLLVVAIAVGGRYA